MARKKQTRLAESHPSAVEQPAEVTLDRLIGALPEQTDLMPLRQALLLASMADASRAWSRSSAYATLDKRVIGADTLASVVAAAAREEHARVDVLYENLRGVLESVANGDEVAATMGLLRIGETAEAQDNLPGAIAYFEVAARAGAALSDRKVQIMALRHLARAHLGMGDMERALLYYRQALEKAASASETEWQVVALTGVGNVFALQGRWQEAVDSYQAARRLCGDNFARKRGQLAINLASALRELGELAEAGRELARATELWSELDRSDHSHWYNDNGLLALARAEYDSADTSFRQALETAEGDFHRAMVLDNVADSFIHQGKLNDAEIFARSAEEAALRAGSPRALAEIYMRLGMIFRLRSELDGVTFFEKALELCRGRTYPLTEANAYLEYGIFRRVLGDNEEARSCFERALQLCAEIGATQLGRTAADQLAQL
jgi:tetratricopeptide (TPR) repeat protein